MAYRHLLIEADHGIVVVSLNRAPVNALNRELLGELSRVCDELSTDTSARVLILQSSMDHFCAGADLKERQGMSDSDVQHFVKHQIGGTIHKLGDLSIPTIAAIHGSALGGGCELALACDFRIAADNLKMGLRETALAIIPGAGGTQRLPRLIGYSQGLLWILTARVFDASECVRQGVVNQVVPRTELSSAARALADEIIANGPIAVRLAKKAVRDGLATSLAEGLQIENTCYNEIIPTKDRREALKAFAEKRKPNWTNS